MKNLLLLIATAGGAMAATPALAREPMTDAQMSAQRAGFMTPMGFEVGLGANIRTYVDGSLAVETRLTWTEQGLIREVVSGQETPDAKAKAAQLGLNLDGDWQGLIIEHADGGVSTALTSIGGERVASMLTNSASDQDLRLETEINVVIPNLDSLQQQFLQDQAVANVQDMVGSALAASALP
jgi:hypothetical protein